MTEVATGCCDRYSVAGYMGAFGSLTWSSFSCFSLLTYGFFRLYRNQKKKEREKKKAFVLYCIEYLIRAEEEREKMEVEGVMHVVLKGTKKM